MMMKISYSIRRQCVFQSGNHPPMNQVVKNPGIKLGWAAIQQRGLTETSQPEPFFSSATRFMASMALRAK